MTAFPYMPLYVSDFMADTAHLTAEEAGAYLLLIMSYWQRGKALPDDNERLARIARLSNERWTDVQRTLSEFFTIEDGLWTHGRVEKEIERAKVRSAQASKAGKSSAAQRALNGRSTDVERTLNGRSTNLNLTLEEDNNSVPSESDAARARKVQVSSSKTLKGSEGEGGRIATLTKRAEGLGLDVAGMLAICERQQPKDMRAYFFGMCAKRLKDKLPAVPDDLIVAALNGRKDAYTIVTLGLMEGSCALQS